MTVRVLPWLILPLLASCVGPRAPAPAPAPRPAAPQVPAAPAAAPERYAGDWTTADLTPGEWRYADGTAHFANGTAASLAEMRCASGTINLTRTGIIPQDIGAFITVRTSFGERRLPIQSADQQARRLTSRLAAADPLWDQIIYSRGRFVIEATMQAPVILPNRPEIARVVEDCRG
jgi:hypothetical protein